MAAEKVPSARPCNANLVRVLSLTREMLALADEGDRDREDPSCAIVYGLLRDMAYRLRKLAEEECSRHRASGKWDRAGAAEVAPASEEPQEDEG